MSLFVRRPRNPTRLVRIGSIEVGAGRPIAVQSMATAKTRDPAAAARQAEVLRKAGAGVVRVAVDTDADAVALPEIRRLTSANLVVDLQENWRLAESVAPHVDKIRYNPGHLHHLERGMPAAEKVRWIAGVCSRAGIALRIGVNCGSVDPEYDRKYAADPIEAMVRCALDHCRILDESGFTQYLVSLKDSDPARVVEANVRFARSRPDVPLHLGVTEAGLLPEGEEKTRRALLPLLARGIGDTLRVSLTVPSDLKTEEIRAGLAILSDLEAGRFSEVNVGPSTANIISCPSCARVENEAFVSLAEKVRDMVRALPATGLTIAVMGCRVNGPGETDDADLGLWCGPTVVNLKRKSALVGAFSYDEILERFRREIDALIVERQTCTPKQEGTK